MKKIIGLFLMVFSVNCFADWINVSTTEDGIAKFYVDFSTKKKVGGYIRVWSLMDLNRTHKIRSYKALEDYDCNADRIRLIQLTSYSGRMGSGSVIETTRGADEWDYVIPGSVEATKFRRVCN